MTKGSARGRSKPAGVKSADAASAILLRIETDIASVYLARLQGLFDRKSLGLDGGAPPDGSFLARVGKAEFWTCALCRKDQMQYSAAARFYLQHLFPEQAGIRFRDYCQVWGQSFYASRHDIDSTRDMLLLFLDQNLLSLKRLYILAQPHNRDLRPDTHALERCFDAADNAMLFVGDRFSRWVLEEWLPYLLRHVCCRQFATGEQAPACECVHVTLWNVSAMVN